MNKMLIGGIICLVLGILGVLRMRALDKKERATSKIQDNTPDIALVYSWAFIISGIVMSILGLIIPFD